jgi:TolB-like protein
MRMRKTLFILMFISGLLARQSIVYFYVIPFDNIKADPTVEWIASGLSDMVSNRFKSEPGLLIQNKKDLEIIMNDRSLMLKQPLASRNLLLVGKYYRQLEKINVSVQLIDLATWDQIETKDIAAEYSDISKMKKEIGDNIRSMIATYLPKGKNRLAAVLPKFIEPKPAKRRHPVSVKSGMVTNNLEDEFDKLEESMDVLLGLKEDKNLKPKKDVTFFDTGGEWTMDFSANSLVEENPELAPNTEMLRDVLKKLIDNPYNVIMEKPKFIYHKDDDSYITVQFHVTYSLKNEIIKDMLNALPYNGLEQNGSLTIFYFSKESFNLTDDITSRIISGKYRSVPVIRFFNKQGTPIVVVADTPEEQWHSRKSDKVLYLPENQFTPMIEFTVGGWSMQVAMETVNIHANYEFILPMSDVENLSNVSLKFINEDELKKFLEPIL